MLPVPSGAFLHFKALVHLAVVISTIIYSVNIINLSSSSKSEFPPHTHNLLLGCFVKLASDDIVLLWAGPLSSLQAKSS